MADVSRRLETFAKQFKERPRGPQSTVDQMPAELLAAVRGYYERIAKDGRKPDHAMLAAWLKAEGQRVDNKRLAHYYRTRYVD